MISLKNKFGILERGQMSGAFSRFMGRKGKSCNKYVITTSFINTKPGLNYTQTRENETFKCLLLR